MLKVGDKVRAYDHVGRFEAPRLNGVIGTILAIDVKSAPLETGQTYIFDCPRYAIMIDSSFMGDEITSESSRIVYPPMNGTPTTMSEITDCVETLEG